jgi:CRISPR-associated protein Cas2
MLLISYDIANDKVRAKFSKFIKKYGHRVQYSVYEVHNSDRVIDNICAEIEAQFEPLFAITDSILLFPISASNEERIVRY